VKGVGHYVSVSEQKKVYRFA